MNFMQRRRKELAVKTISGYDPMRKVFDYVQQNATRYVAPMVVAVQDFKTIQIASGLSILYLPTIKEHDIVPVTKGYTAFELGITCHPVDIGDGECIVLPIDSKNGRGLTGQCACLRCVDKVVRRARSEQRDIMTEVTKELSCPVRYITQDYGNKHTGLEESTTKITEI